MITKKDLMDRAPKGVDYIHIEKHETLFVVSIFYHHECRGWYKAHIGYGDFSRKTADEVWKEVLRGGQTSKELPRRWAAQRKLLEDWIVEIGLWNRYCKFLNQKFDKEPNAVVYVLTPEQQEKRPKFALQFLKDRLKWSLHVPESGEEVIVTAIGDTSRKPLDVEEPLIEPPCACSNISWGHDPNCEWKKWKQTN